LRSARIPAGRLRSFQLRLHPLDLRHRSFHLFGAWAARCRLTGTQGCVRYVNFFDRCLAFVRYTDNKTAQL